jgi:hypothetical protein
MNGATLRAQLAQVATDHAESPRVLEAAREVEARLESNVRIVGWADWEACLRWSRADAGLLDRGRFRYSCERWAQELNSALLRLSSQLKMADDWPRAEVIASLADETETAVEQAQETIGDPIAWGAETPWWVFAGVSFAALLTWKALD